MHQFRNFVYILTINFQLKIKIKFIDQMHLFQQSKTLKKNTSYIPAYENVSKTYQSNLKQCTKQNFNSTKQQNSISKNCGSKNISKTNNYNQSKSISQNSLKNSYVSPYNNQTRLQRILKLKPTNNNCKNKITKFDIESHISSTNSIKSNTKSNNRLQKIMKLKVSKPVTSSALKNYEPPRIQRSISTTSKKSESSILQMKELKKNMDRINKQKDKEQRLWKNFERERQKNFKQRQKNEEIHYLKQRRIQKKIEAMVSKEICKIQNEKTRQMKKKKNCK